MSVKATELFEKMGPVLEKSGAEIVKKVGAIFLFEIKANKDAEPVFFTVDLKNGNGKILEFQYLYLLQNCGLLIFIRQNNKRKRGNTRYHLYYVG